jgi:hypothetical protein
MPEATTMKLVHEDVQHFLVNKTKEEIKHYKSEEVY